LYKFNREANLPKIKDASKRLIIEKDTAQAFLFILVFFLLSRFFYFFIYEIWLLLLESEVLVVSYTAVDVGEPFLSAMMRWDTGWYQGIIENGYDVAPWGHAKGDAANWAFFPLYPLSVYLFKSVFSTSTYLSGMLVSTIFFLTALVYVYKYLSETRNEKIAYTAIVLLLLGPYSFYFSTMYSESLFIMLVVMNFYYLKKENWLVCSVTAACFSATRVIGVLFWIPLLIKIIRLEYRKTSNILHILRNIICDYKKLLVLLAAPMGLFAYMTYLHFHTGDAFAFYHIQKAWSRSNTNPLILMINLIREGGIPKLYLAAWGILGIILSIYLLVKRHISEGIFGLICIIIPLLSNLQSLPRYFIGTGVTIFALVEVFNILPKYYKWPLIVLYCTLNPILLILWFAQHYIVT
jgi:hypothetical protein